MKKYNSALTTKEASLELITNTQVKMSYINPLCAQVFSSEATYAPLQSDVLSINTLGNHLFSYLGNDDTTTEKVWYLELQTGITQTLSDIIALKASIDECALNCGVGQELSDMLDALTVNCNAIAQLIPVYP